MTNSTYEGIKKIQFQTNLHLMNRRSFVKVSGKSFGSIMFVSSIAEFLTSCTKSTIFNNSVGGTAQLAILIETSFLTPLNIPKTVGSNATLIPQNTTANIGGNSLHVLGYQPNGILGPTIQINKGDNLNIQVLFHQKAAAFLCNMYNKDNTLKNL